MKNILKPNKDIITKEYRGKYKSWYIGYHYIPTINDVTRFIKIDNFYKSHSQKPNYIKMSIMYNENKNEFEVIIDIKYEYKEFSIGFIIDYVSKIHDWVKEINKNFIEEYKIKLQEEDKYYILCFWNQYYVNHIKDDIITIIGL